jgi:hypothetical protein
MSATISLSNERIIVSSSNCFAALQCQKQRRRDDGDTAAASLAGVIRRKR